MSQLFHAIESLLMRRGLTILRSATPAPSGGWMRFRLPDGAVFEVTIRRVS